MFVVWPRFFRSQMPQPVSYTVKIVDAVPAGNLGTRLPPLASERVRHHEPSRRPRLPAHEHSSIIPPRAPDHSKNLLALNTVATPTPTPQPPPEPEPSVTATPNHLRQHRHEPTPTPTPRPRRVRQHHAAPRPTVAIAKAAPTPDIRRELEELHKQLEAENREMKHQLAERTPIAHPSPAPEGGEGEVVANTANNGTGLGVGTGTGSAGILQDPEFLAYYETVQDRIKKAWSFAGNNPNLTTEALFAIDANGQLTGVKIVESSNDSAYDQSVMRAIRRAAPFPPPPEKYRSQFAQGVQAIFKLGAMQS
jgi:protein TonB